MMRSDIHRIAQAWSIYEFNPRLSHALVVALENSARWAMLNNFAPRQDMPDFSANFYPDALKAVRASAVTIIQ